MCADCTLLVLNIRLDRRKRVANNIEKVIARLNLVLLFTAEKVKRRANAARIADLEFTLGRMEVDLIIP